MPPTTVLITKNDWGLHRKGQADAARHQEKVKQAIRGNLADIVSQEAIITSDGKQIVKVPVRGLDLPRFKFNYSKGGEEQVGSGQGKGGKQAGNQPGVDYYEVGMEIDELAAMIFEDFALPNLKNKPNQQLTTPDIQHNDLRKNGIFSNLDKRKTLLEAMKRTALQGKPFSIVDSDRRFRTWNEIEKPTTNAVVIAMRDVSASMGEFEKYITRTFYFWMVRFLRTKYEKVEVVFITHHTEAKEVGEREFFELGESGGTQISSAYKLALEIIQTRYNPQNWNIYPFHFSDGDNWGSGDNELCIRLIEEILSKCNLFGYGEISKTESSLWGQFEREISNPQFTPVQISEKEDVYKSLKKFFAPRGLEV